MGKHENAVSTLTYALDHGLLISGSWDATIKLWDPKNPGTGATSTAQLPDRVYAADTVDNRVVVATANRHVWIFDVRNMSQPTEKRESSLNYATTCLRCFPKGDGYVTGSIEGRVAADFFDASAEVQKNKKYAFKCHREKKDDVETVYAIKALAFHPKYVFKTT